MTNSEHDTNGRDGNGDVNGRDTSGDAAPAASGRPLTRRERIIRWATGYHSLEWWNEAKERPSMSMVPLTITAVMVGFGTGIIASYFRVCLEHAEAWRTTVFGWSQGHGIIGVIVAIVAPAVLAMVGAAMVRHLEPVAEGSGIPRVEAIVKGNANPTHMRLLPIKFVGGLMSIGGGLALGREGPSVHLGASVATILGRTYRNNRADLRLLIAAGAAAGLTTAFSAPLAGAVFVLEELVKRFEARMTVAVLSASGAAYSMAHVIVGDDHVFPLPEPAPPTLDNGPFFLFVGLVAGFAGLLYNRTLMRTLAVVDASTFPVELRAGMIGAAIGVVGYLGPNLVGGGDSLTMDALMGRGTVMVLLGLLILRFIMAIGSYVALTPGGLFAPMLVLGAELGLIVGLVCHALFPQVAPDPSAMAIVGMAALFAASVGAPVTGLVLTTEMTGAVVLLPPLLGACAAAMFIAVVFKCRPIYDALGLRSARNVAKNAAAIEERTQRAMKAEHEQ